MNQDSTKNPKLPDSRAALRERLQLLRDYLAELGTADLDPASALRHREARRVLAEVLDELGSDAPAETIAPQAVPSRDIAVAIMRDVGRVWADAARRRGMELRTDIGQHLPDRVHAVPEVLLPMVGRMLRDALSVADTAVLLQIRGNRKGELEIVVRGGAAGHPDLSESSSIESADPKVPAIGEASDLGRGAPGSAYGVRLVLRANSGGPTGDPGKAGTAPARGQDDQAQVSGKRVLLVGPEGPHRKTVKHMLGHLGLEVFCSISGAAAPSRLRIGSFDGVVIDTDLDDIEPGDLLARLRSQDGPSEHLPLLAITALEGERRDALLHAGADDVMSKPLPGIAQFEARLKQLLMSPAHRVAAEATVPTRSDPRSLGIAPSALDDLLDMTGPDRRQELLEGLLADLGDVAAGLARTETSGDPQDAREHSHVLISLSGAVGATTVLVRARQLNALAHEGNRAAMLTLTRQLRSDVDGLLGHIRRAAERSVHGVGN
ncbi:response regulator [Aliiruegeria haliotis]|uniref:response regulator n=1 Tax=Aliiruegeria haliotis TaxID=1280846 RepID=UPI001304C6D7|nr:hypothetical protein [Aliiruegeria haliotis]